MSDSVASLLDYCQYLRDRIQVEHECHPLDGTAAGMLKAIRRLDDGGTLWNEMATSLRIMWSWMHQTGLPGAPAYPGDPTTELQTWEAIATAENWLRRCLPDQHLKATHNADFTMVNWFGTVYYFALGVQSSAVKALWEEWVKSGLGLHQETVRYAIDSERDSFRMDTAFRNHKAFGTMIQPCGDGRYQLVPPDSHAAAPATKNKRDARITSRARRARG